MMDPQEQLTLLGYDRRWLTYSFLDLALLDAQHVACLTSDDRHPEHYRFASFGQFLRERSAVSDAELDRYVELAVLDPDKVMAGSALAELLAWPGLGPVQFERLASHTAFELPFLQHLVVRRRLLAAISAGPIDDALLASCLASYDSAVQRAFVSVSGVAGSHLALLAQNGCNRAVRNLASQQLRLRLNDSPN